MTVSVRDKGIAAGLFIGTLVYLWFWPRELNGYDESLYLYEAKRVYQGAVMYRDFFDLITPVWFYVMAAMYGLFGVTIETARWTMAITHGLIGALTFLTCRVTGVPRLLAVMLASTHLVLGYPACPIATPHWFSTLATVLLLFTLLRWPPTTTVRAFVCGLLVGFLTLVQQQKGLLIGLGTGVVLLVTPLIEVPRPEFARIVRRIIAYALGVATLVVPVMLFFVAKAGFDDVFNALVHYPLVNYRRMVGNAVPWGGYFPPAVPHGYIIKYLPAVVPLGAAWLIWGWRRGQRAALLRAVILVIYSAFVLWAVFYLPDHLHFAYMAPVWFALAGFLATQVLPARAFGRVMTAVVALLIVAGGWQAYETLHANRLRSRYQFDSPFGRIDTPNPDAGAIYEWFEELFRRVGATHIFSFPTNAVMYLVLPVDNPTRYQIVLPHYTEREDLVEITQVLERERTPFVVRNYFLAPNQLEPLNTYLREHYTPLPLPDRLFKNTNITHVYRRNPEPAQASATF